MRGEVIAVGLERRGELCAFEKLCSEHRRTGAKQVFSISNFIVDLVLRSIVLSLTAGIERTVAWKSGIWNFRAKRQKIYLRLITSQTSPVS